MEEEDRDGMDGGVAARTGDGTVIRTFLLGL